MVALNTPLTAAEPTIIVRRQDRDELAASVNLKTFRQVRDLHVVLESGRVTLRGRSESYYVKQLATHAVQELLPGAAIDNAISVQR
ncbi:MAG: BON domain-containing protein [Planctomycetota bacterium]